MKNWNIDLGDEQIKETPFAERKSISILLGAGFSAPIFMLNKYHSLPLLNLSNY